MWGLIGVTFMHAEKKETLLQNQPIRQRLLQIVFLKSLPQWGCCFLRRKLIQHFVRQAKLNSHQGFLAQLVKFLLSCLEAFSLSLVMLSSTRYGSGWLYSNLPPAEIDDTIELLNIEFDRRHLHFDLALISIVVKLTAPMTNRWDDAVETTRDRWATRRKRKKIFLIIESQHSIYRSFTDQTDHVYVYERRGRNFIKFWESIIWNNYTYH